MNKQRYILDKQQASETPSTTDRREFLQTAGKAAVAAPAVTLLLSAAASKSARASGVPPTTHLP
jgi:hypothetical protein